MDTIHNWINAFASNEYNDYIIDVVSDYADNDPFKKFCGKLFLYHFIINDCDFEALRKLYDSGFLNIYIPEFKNSHSIYQNKKYGLNLLDHSLLCCSSSDYVLDYFEQYFDFDSFWLYIDYDVIKFSCLLHDIGKIHNVEQHPKYSAILSDKICSRFTDLSSDKFVSNVSAICLNHMFPLGYQRGEKWSDSAVNKFIERCGNSNLAIATVLVAACDKYSSTRKLEYLKPLIDLCSRICSMEK